MGGSYKLIMISFKTSYIRNLNMISNAYEKKSLISSEKKLQLLTNTTAESLVDHLLAIVLKLFTDSKNFFCQLHFICFKKTPTNLVPYLDLNFHLFEFISGDGENLK